MLRLHCFSQSGNSYKVAFLPRALGQPFDTQFVDFMNGATRAPNWREQANEMGEVPVLEGGTRRLTQSGVILSYLAEKALRRRHRRRAPGSATLVVLRQPQVHELLCQLSFRQGVRPERARSGGAGLAEGSNRCRLRDSIDKHLAAIAYIVGTSPTIADFSLCGYLFYPVEESGYDVVQRFPNIAAWLIRVRALPGWALPYDILPGARIAPKW